MPRFLALAVLAALTAPDRVVAQGRETDTLSTASPLARVAYLTQLDRLDDTRSDDARCGAAASLNAFVLLGGSIDTVARLFGLPPDHTIGTAHRVQKRLYLHADVDGVAGAIGSTTPVTDANGAIVSSRRSASDEFHRMLDVLGLDAEPLFGGTLATVAERDRAVHEYLRRNAHAVFIVGADADLGKGARPSRAPTAGSANHYIVVARVDAAWQKVDSWYRPGQRTVSRLTEAEVRGFLHRTPVTPWGITRAPNSAPRLAHAGYDVPPDGHDLMPTAARAATVARRAVTPLAPLDLFRLETVSDPQLSPDGTRVVYVRQSYDIMRDRAVTQLWMVNADESVHRRLTAGDGDDRAPRWTPSGDAIIYLSSVDGTTQLFRRDVGSEQAVRLARLPATPEWFTLSPDGAQIAFAMLVASPPHVPAGMPSAPSGAAWAPAAIVATDLQQARHGCRPRGADGVARPPSVPCRGARSWRACGAPPRDGRSGALYVRSLLGGRHAGLAPFPADVLAEYERCASDPATVHAICEDYRASAGIDLAHGRDDRAAGRQLRVPLSSPRRKSRCIRPPPHPASRRCSSREYRPIFSLLAPGDPGAAAPSVPRGIAPRAVRVLWGQHGVIAQCFDVLHEWRRVAESVDGRALECGHDLAEDAPDALCADILPFLATHTR